MLLVFGAMLILTAIGVIAAQLGAFRTAPPEGVSRSLSVLDAMTTAPEELVKREADRPFDERVLGPLRERAVALGRRLSGRAAPERIRRRLDLAGNPRGWGEDRVLAGKILGAIVVAVVGLGLGLMTGMPLLLLPFCALIGAGVGFYAPDLYLYQLSYNRSLRIQRELPDAIDLLTISVEAGLGFDAAVLQVAQNTDGPVGEEFSRVLREMQIGQGRTEALRAFADRSEVDDLKSFVGAMVQADKLGIPVGQVLRVQSHEIRVKRRQRAETKAQQVPVKITVPLIFCILPALFVSVMGPAVLTVLDSFAG